MKKVFSDIKQSLFNHIGLSKKKPRTSVGENNKPCASESQNNSIPENNDVRMPSIDSGPTTPSIHILDSQSSSPDSSCSNRQSAAFKDQLSQKLRSRTPLPNARRVYAKSVCISNESLTTSSSWTPSSPSLHVSGQSQSVASDESANNGLSRLQHRLNVTQSRSHRSPSSILKPTNPITPSTDNDYHQFFCCSTDQQRTDPRQMSNSQLDFIAEENVETPLKSANCDIAKTDQTDEPVSECESESKRFCSDHKSDMEEEEEEQQQQQHKQEQQEIMNEHNHRIIRFIEDENTSPPPPVPEKTYITHNRLKPKSFSGTSNRELNDQINRPKSLSVPTAHKSRSPSPESRQASPVNGQINSPLTDTTNEIGHNGDVVTTMELVTDFKGDCVPPKPRIRASVMARNFESGDENQDFTEMSVSKRVLMINANIRKSIISEVISSTDKTMTEVLDDVVDKSTPIERNNSKVLDRMKVFQN